MSKTTQSNKAVFTQGSTMRHVVVMTATSSIGLVSIFFVDAINLYYISLLGREVLTAALGFAAAIMFFSISICIGLAIAAAALVGRAIGAQDEAQAKGLATASLIYMILFSGLFAVCLFPVLPACLRYLGAEGETLAFALTFMRIVVPSIPLLGLGMVFGALLRAKGDPKRAMFVTLSGGAAALVLDPLFIFGFGLELTGAAMATFCVRITLVAVGLWGVHGVHSMLGRPDFSQTVMSARPFLMIAIPAVATQLATPVGNAYVTAAISDFGDDAVIGWTIVGRLIPVAFGTIFALSGAVGPILSQNYGAKIYNRVNQVMRDALLFTLVYCLVVWGLLALLNPLLLDLFNTSGDAASMVQLFNYFVAGSFLFNGFLFVANAAFNNLGFPIYATIFNWGRATLGVVPFVAAGKSYGALGILAGWGLGGVVFGLGAVFVAFRVIKKLPERESKEAAPHRVPAGDSAFSSGKSASFGFSSGKDD